MSTNLYWKPHEAEPRSAGFSYFVKKLVQQTWGTPAVLSEPHVEILRAWGIFATSMGGADFQHLGEEMHDIIGLIEKHGSIELYEY